MKTQTEETEKKTPKKQNKVVKIITWVIMGVLGLAILGMLFIYLVPGYGFYYVKTGSMKPNINPGDIVINGPVGGALTGSLNVGKVITFKSTDYKTVVTHRIVAIDNGMITTKGDANPHADVDPVPVSAVIGIYMFKIPAIGYINGFVSTRSGWFIVIIIPSILLVLFLVKDIIRESLKGSKKKEVKETTGGDAYQGKNKDEKQATDTKLEPKL